MAFSSSASLRGRVLNHPRWMFVVLVWIFLTFFRSHTVEARSGSSSSSKVPIRTWSFMSPNRRMEWTELPSHVTLTSRAVVGSTEVLNDSDSDVDVLVVAVAKDDESDDGVSSALLFSEDASTLMNETLSLLRDEIQNAPAGTLSSKVMLLPDAGTAEPNPQSSQRRARYLCCIQLGDVAAAAAAVNQTTETAKGNTTSDAEKKKSQNKKKISLGRSLGSTLASMVTEQENDDKKKQQKDKSEKPEKKHKKKSSPPRTKRILVVLPASLVDDDDDADSAAMSVWTELACSFWTSLYRDKRYKGSSSGDEKEEADDSPPTPVQVELVVLQCPTDVEEEDDDDSTSTTVASSVQSALERGQSQARGIYLAKDIVNAPHNSLNSESLAESATRLAHEYPAVLTCRILGVEECERRGMGAFLGVARGSETAAQFIHLTYKPPRKGWWTMGSGGGGRLTPKRLGIIGKGLLFDTGGYNIKTRMMDKMKFDCGGAAAVLGAARTIAEQQPHAVEVHFCIAACENMINERAMVPSDILTAANGKTIEVLNTDAEGRLTMADALVYVDQELHCEEIVELSTLTGACIMALGSKVAGLWTYSDALAEELLAVSQTCGESIWRMPLVEEYQEQLKSKIADLKNLGGPYGGAIAAALFLQHFVADPQQSTPFAHIDMAGPVWDMKQSQASGWGARLVSEWVQQKSLMLLQTTQAAAQEEPSNH